MTSLAENFSKKDGKKHKKAINHLYNKDKAREKSHLLSKAAALLKIFIAKYT